MKNLFFLLLISSLSFNLVAQDNTKIKAFIIGHEPNDTIQLQDLLKAEKLILNDSDHTIISFTMSFKDINTVKILSSNSEKITNEMTYELENREDKERQFFTLYFEEIIASTKSGKKVQVSPTIYRIRTKYP